MLEHTQDFLAFCSVERGQSERTIQTYTYVLRFLQDYLENQKQDIHDITTSDLRSFLMQRKSKGLSPKTLTSYVFTLKNYFTFLCNEGYLRENPALPLKAPKYYPPTVKYFTDAQRSKFLSTPVSRNNPTLALRDTVAFHILAYCGLRRTELLSLKVDDVDLGQKTLLIRRGKGGRSRTVPLRDDLVELLDTYLRSRLPITNPSLFLSLGGKKSLKREGFGKAFRQHLRTCGLPEDLHPHSLRHGLATSILRRTGNLAVVKELLGHVNISTTMHYTHLVLDDLRKAQELV
jgi:integrase/recombinase XerD